MEDRWLCLEALDECVTQLREDDRDLSDPHCHLLRGLVNTISYISALHPECIVIDSEEGEGEEKWMDIVGGRISLLARSKLVGNILAYVTAVHALTLALRAGREAQRAEAERIALLMGNYIQRVECREYSFKRSLHHHHHCT